MTNFIDGWLPLKLAWKPTQPDKNVSVTVKVPSCQLALGLKDCWDLLWRGNGFELETELVCIKSFSGPGDWICRSGCGAPLTNSTGISVREPESEAGLLCTPCWRACWPGCLTEDFSGLRLLSNVLVLEPSLKEPDVRVRIDSGESASSLARDKLLCRQKEKQHLICL